MLYNHSIPECHALLYKTALGDRMVTSGANLVADREYLSHLDRGRGRRGFIHYGILAKGEAGAASLSSSYRTQTSSCRR